MIFQGYSMALNTFDTLPSAPQGYILSNLEIKLPQMLGETIISQVASNKEFLILWQMMREYQITSSDSQFCLNLSKLCYFWNVASHVPCFPATKLSGLRMNKKGNLSLKSVQIIVYMQCEKKQNKKTTKNTLQEYNVLLLINSFNKYLLCIYHMSDNDASG